MLKVLLTVGFLQGLTMLVNLGRTKVLAVLLGPDWVGVMAIVDKLLAVLAQTASLSLPFAVVRFLPGLWGRAQGEFAALMRRMRNLLSVLALVATLVGILVTLLVPQVWGRELLPYRSLLFVALLSLPALMFVPFLQNAMAARLQPNQSMLFTLVHATVWTLTSVLGVLWKGLSGLYALYAFFTLFLIIPVIRMVEGIPGPEAPAAPDGGRFPLRLPGCVWRFSLALSGLTFVTPFAALYVHYQVLSHFGVTTAGWMQAAMGIGLVVRNLLGRAHAIFLTPNVNRGGSPEKRMQWAEEFQKTFSFVCIACALPLVLFPHTAVTLLYSAAFRPAAPFVAWFVAGEVLVMLAGTYQALVVAFDHMAFHVTQNLVAQVVLLAVAGLMIKPYGILGVGVAGIVAQLVLYGGSTLFLRWRYGLKVPRRSGLLTVFVMASLGLGGLVGGRHPGLSLGVLAGKVSLYGILMGGLWMFLTPADRANLYTLVRDVRARLHSQGVV